MGRLVETVMPAGLRLVKFFVAEITDLPGLPRGTAASHQGYVAKAPFSHNCKD